MEQILIEIPENSFRFESQWDWNVFCNDPNLNIDKIYSPEKFPCIGWPNATNYDYSTWKHVTIWAFVYPIQTQS